MDASKRRTIYASVIVLNSCLWTMLTIAMVMTTS